MSEVNVNNAEDVIKPRRSLLVNSLEVGLMGVAIVIGGQLYGWNEALSAGFGSWIIAQSLMGLAYFCLVLCISEITSGIAFDGGSYGIARVMIGLFPGFLISFIEYSEYIMMTSAAVSFIGSAFVDLIGCDTDYKPLIWMIFLAFAFLTCLDKTSVRAMCYLCGGGSFLLVLVYSLGCVRYTSLEHNAPLATSDDDAAQSNGVWFSGGGIGFMATLTLATWHFAGIEALTLMTTFTATPKVHISRGLLVGMGALFVSSTLVSWVASTLPPGLSSTQSLTYFMGAGLDQAFGASELLSLVLILPGQFAMAWGFLLPFGSLLHAMAESKFVPKISSMINNQPHVPYLGIGCLICYLVCLVGWVFPDFDAVIQNVAILSGLVSYIAQLVAFVKLRTVFSTVVRKFRSPLGIPGAVFSAVMFVACFISTAFFQDDDYVAVISFAVLVALITVYYYGYAKHKQTLSALEQKELFRLNVIAFNIRKSSQAKGVGHSNGRQSSSTMTGIFTLYRHKVSSVRESYKVHSLDDSRRSVGSVGGRRSVESIGGRRRSVESSVVHKEIATTVNKGDFVENFTQVKGESKYGLEKIESSNEELEKADSFLFVSRKVLSTEFPSNSKVHPDDAFISMNPTDIV